jgi:hypothetical protein
MPFLYAWTDGTRLKRETKTTMTAHLDWLDRLEWLLGLVGWLIVCSLCEIGWAMLVADDTPPLPERPRLVRWRREAREGIRELAEFL